MCRIRIVKERYKLVSSSLNGVVTFASRPSLCHEINMPRIPFPRDTLYGRGNQSTEMSDFLLSTLDLRVSQDSSFSDGPTLF